MQTARLFKNGRSQALRVLSTIVELKPRDDAAIRYEIVLGEAPQGSSPL